MSVKRYRKVMAAALVASVGLTGAACTSESGKDAAGNTVITVDCPPLKTDNDGKSLVPGGDELLDKFNGVDDGPPDSHGAADVAIVAHGKSHFRVTSDANGYCLRGREHVYLTDLRRLDH